MNTTITIVILIAIIAILVSGIMIWIGYGVLSNMLKDKDIKPPLKDFMGGINYQDNPEEYKAKYKEWKDLGPQVNWDNDEHWEPETFEEWEARNYPKSGKTPKEPKAKKPTKPWHHCLPHGTWMVLLFSSLTSIFISGCAGLAKIPSPDLTIPVAGQILAIKDVNQSVLFDAHEYKGWLDLAEVTYHKTKQSWERDKNQEYSFNIHLDTYQDNYGSEKGEILWEIHAHDQALKNYKQLNFIHIGLLVFGIFAFISVIFFMGYLEEWGRDRKEIYKN